MNDNKRQEIELFHENKLEFTIQTDVHLPSRFENIGEGIRIFITRFVEGK